MSHTPRTPLRPRRRGHRAAQAVLAVALVTLAQACGEDTPGPQTRTYVTDAQLLGADVSAVLQNAFLPDGSPDGPAVTVQEAATVINGGSLQVPVTASAEFERLLVAVTTVAEPDAASPPPAEPGPVRGYYELTLPEPATEATLVLTIAQALPVSSFQFDFAAVAPGGVQGVPSQQAASAVSVGAGAVQVSVSWDAASDVDLHVVEPSGEEIYWQTMTSTSGGVLDLDSNANCEIDDPRVNNENITFTDAPPGEYTVRVDYYAGCDVERTAYVVTVQLPGQEAQVFDGEFTGDGDGGGEGAGELITSFTVADSTPAG
jgi:hypothetical protein